MAEDTVTASSEKFTKVAFVIEFGDDKNRNFVWPPDKKQLRGKWDKNVDAHLAPQEDPRFRNVPSLPGIRLQVEISRAGGSARFFDPLQDPEYTRDCTTTSKVVKEIWGKEQGAEPERIVPFEDANEAKTWIFWARRFLDAKGAAVVEGTVPTMQEIARMPGKIISNNFDNGEAGGTLRDIPKKLLVETR